MVGTDTVQWSSSAIWQGHGSCGRGVYYVLIVVKKGNCVMHGWALRLFTVKLYLVTVYSALS